MDNATLVCVIMCRAVPLIDQLLAAPVGRGSYGGFARAAFDNFNGTMEDCYGFALLSTRITGKRKRNRREAGVSFLLARKGFGERSSPSRPKDATAPGRAHGTG